jgi:hypothetical protein
MAKRMVRKRVPRKNEVQSIGLIREKRDAIYLVTLIFDPGYGPILISDESGGPQLDGGDYEIKKATWDHYDTTGEGTLIEPDKPLSDRGEGPVTRCKVLYEDGVPIFMWDREEDFAFTGPGVRMHVRKLNRPEYRLREALETLREEHPDITQKSANQRVAKVVREVVHRKPRTPYQPTGNKRGAPIKSPFTLEIRRLKAAGDTCREAQKKMFAWHRQRYPVSHPQCRTRESINRSVRRIYGEKPDR